MASSTVSPSAKFDQDQVVWDSLKQAISNSSGFRQWKGEHRLEDESDTPNFEYQVRHYLRETLETLAY